MDYIPSGIEIIRVPSALPLKLNRFLNSIKIFRLFWFFLYPFFWERSAMWPFKTYKTAARIIKENNIKTVYTSSGPFSSLILGYLLKKRLGIKWVADMRDPFTDAYAWSYPSKLHWYLCRFFEKKFLSKASHIVVNTPEVKKLYLSRTMNDDSHITVITNGY
jgi:glycosyltransferase involved in cell wall biosynthesis